MIRKSTSRLSVFFMYVSGKNCDMLQAAHLHALRCLRCVCQQATPTLRKSTSYRTICRRVPAYSFLFIRVPKRVFADFGRSHVVHLTPLHTRSVRSHIYTSHITTQQRQAGKQTNEHAMAWPCGGRLIVWFGRRARRCTSHTRRSQNGTVSHCGRLTGT